MREMKDSRIPGIGQIPFSWTVSRLKYHFSFGKGLPITKADLADNGLSVISYGQIHSKLNHGVEIDHRLIRYVDSVYQERYPQCRLCQYDFVFADTSEDLDGCGNFVYLRNNDVLFAGYHVLFIRPFLIEDKRYYGYLFLSDAWRRQLRDSVTGIKVFSITKDILGEAKTLIPPQKERACIADYLDESCKKIYAVIEDIFRQIAVLEQFKHSIICEAVTQGLNRQVEMRESGIKWVSHLPAHWAIIPSKYLFQDSDVRKQTGDVQLTASQKYGIISQEEYMERENAKVVLANQGLNDWKHVEPYDFVISLRSFQGGLEMSETTGCITWHYVVLKATKPIYPKFYKWLFKSSMYITAIQQTCNFIRDGQDLRYSNFSQVPLYEPPLEEQKEIADYLDKKCAEIDAVIATKQKQLETLDAYKKSMIFEYVTGKKEVQ